MKLYIIETALWEGGDVSGFLMNEGGEALWGHFSSSRSWLEADLLRNFGHEAELAETYGDYELVYVRADDDLPEEISEHFKKPVEVEQ